MVYVLNTDEHYSAMHLCWKAGLLLSVLKQYSSLFMNIMIFLIRGRKGKILFNTVIYLNVFYQKINISFTKTIHCRLHMIKF